MSEHYRAVGSYDELRSAGGGSYNQRPPQEALEDMERRRAIQELGVAQTRPAAAQQDEDDRLLSHEELVQELERKQEQKVQQQQAGHIAAGHPEFAVELEKRFK